MRTEEEVRIMLRLYKQELAQAISKRQNGYDELNERLILYRQNSIGWLEWILEEENNDD